jgi:hypothetical protein
VAALLPARNPLLWIVIYEKARFESYLFEAGPSGDGGICRLRQRADRN